MRCGSCAGEVQEGSRFCGLCGRTVAPAGAGSVAAAMGAQVGGFAPGPPRDSSAMSLFELPVSRTARAAKIGLVLALDAVLAAAGVYFLMAYFESRGRPAAAPPAVAADAAVRATVEADRPRLVGGEREADTGTGTSTRARPTPRTVAVARADAGTVTGAIAGAVAAADAGPVAVAVAVAVAGAVTGADAGAAAPGADDDQAERLASAMAMVVASHQAQLHRCYERVAKASSTADPLEGTLVLQFTLVPGGRFERVSAVQNDIGSPQLASCVVALVQGWTVPPGPDAPLDFEWPFRFRARP